MLVHSCLSLLTLWGLKLINLTLYYYLFSLLVIRNSIYKLLNFTSRQRKPLCQPHLKIPHQAANPAHKNEKYSNPQSAFCTGTDVSSCSVHFVHPSSLRYPRAPARPLTWQCCSIHFPLSLRLHNLSAELIRTMRSLHPACSLAYMRQILLGKWVTTRSPLDSQWSLSPPAEAATNLLPFGVPGLCKRSLEVLAFLLARLVRKCKCSQYWKYN